MDTKPEGFALGAAEFIAANGQRCPKCGRDESETAILWDTVDVEAGMAWQRFSCECGFAGSDVYRRVGYSYDDEQGKSHDVWAGERRFAVVELFQGLLEGVTTFPTEQAAEAEAARVWGNRPAPSGYHDDDTDLWVVELD